MTALAAIASMLRELPDEQLVLAAGPWLQDCIRAGLGVVDVRALAAPAPTGGGSVAKPRRREPEPDGVRDRVFRALAASATPLLAREVAAAAGIDLQRVKSALQALRFQGRASYVGQSKATRWSVSL